jgi:hypothetical protein
MLHDSGAVLLVEQCDSYLTADHEKDGQAGSASMGQKN